MSYASDYRPTELMALVAARQIIDGEIVFIGTGVPLIAGLLAKFTHAPNITLVFETGIIGSQPLRTVLFIDDNPCHDGALSITNLCRIFSDQQRGYYDLGMLGAAQIDRYGNVNTTVIGDYDQPRVRLPGSGGGNDIGSSARRLVIMAKLERRRFVSKLDHLTTPGYLNGGQSRMEAGLMGGGPIAVITDKCIFGFDEITKEIVLDSIHQDVTVEEVKREISWELKVPSQPKVTELPTEEEIELLRLLDPPNFVLGDTLSTIDFDDWAKLTENMIKTLGNLY